MHAPHDYPSVFAALFQAVLQASWQGSLAIVLVLLVRRVLGARVPARWHHLLWFLVVARLLVPTVALPHSPASLENIPAIAHPFARPPSVLPPDTMAVDPGLFSPVPATVSRPAMPSPEPHRAAMPVAPGRTWSPWVWAAWVWLGGVLVLAGWLAACVVKLRARVRGETLPAPESILAVWQACCQRWLRAAPPRLVVAEWVDSPALVGWWRPTLLIPRDSGEIFSAQDWEHVFAHEIAHLRWRDHWSQLLLLAAWGVHWFNPVVWYGLRRLRADREVAADEWVLRHLQGERALAYGETLFKTLAHRPARLAFQPGMVGISEDGAQMKQRLRRIAAFLPGRRLLGSLAGLAAVASLAAVVLGQGTAEPSAKPAATPAPGAGVVPPLTEQGLRDDLLAAARAGDAKGVKARFNFKDEKFRLRYRSIGVASFEDLLRRNEVLAFTTLYDEAQLLPGDAGKWKPSDDLLRALARDGRTDALDALMARGLDLKRLDEPEKSADAPTAAWIQRRVAEVARQRADIDALEKAAGDGDLDKIRRLLDAGVDVNVTGPDHNTPLIRAVFKNRLEAAQLLLDRGALVDKPRFPGWDYTPLCLVNSVPMAELLKKNGANVHAKLYGRDVSILTYVAEFAGAEVVEWFLQQGLDPKMHGDHTSLLFGLKDGRTARLLLDRGLDPNEIDDSGNPPLCYADSGEVAQALIEHGARVTGFKQPLVPSMISYGFGSADAVAAVLKAGADHDPATLQEAINRANEEEVKYRPDKEKLRQLLLSYGARPTPASEGIQPGHHYEIRVSAEDGTLLGGDSTQVHVEQAFGPGGRSGGNERVGESGTVSFWVNDKATSVALSAKSDGFATAYAGPFEPPTKEKLDAVRFRLERGFRAAVETVDDAGQPIKGARLTAYYPGPPREDLGSAVTDAAGRAVFDHIGRASLTVQASADGFESDTINAIGFDPVKPYRWMLKKAQTLAGSVTDAKTGQPIAAATVKLAGARGPHDETHADPAVAPVLAVADGRGRFALTSLRPDSVYDLYVEASGHGGVLLNKVTVGQPELKVSLGPELTVRGKVIHVPAGRVSNGEIEMSYSQFFKIGDGMNAVGKNWTVKVVDGTAEFVTAPLYDNAVSVQTGRDGVELPVKDLPKSDLVIDLAQPAPKPALEPAATPTPVQNAGTAPVPAPPARIIEIVATASTEDGAPLGYHSAEIHPSLTFGPSGARGYQFFPSFDTDGPSPDGHSLMRIPSDATEVGIAVTREGYAAAFAGPFSPPLEEKLKGLHFTLRKGFDAVVQVVDEAGRPIAGARLKCRYSQPLILDFTETATDAGGRANLAHVGAGSLDLLVRADGYQADEADGIRLDPALPYRWTLKQAQPLPGSVTTLEGQPIAGAKVKLAAVRGPFNETHASTTAAPVWATADAHGRFVLTSLRADSRYFLFVDAPGFGGKLLRAITVAQPEMKVALGPELSARGRFLHVPTASINTADHTFVFNYDQFFDIEGKHWTVGQQGRVEPKGGEADFVIPALYDNAVVIRAEGKEVNVEAGELPKSGLLIDLTPEPVSGREQRPSATGVVTTLGTPVKP